MNILTWNTQWCCGMDGKVSVQRIVHHALEMGETVGGLDVLCLQEVAVNYPALQGSPGDQLAELQALLPSWQIFFGASIDEFTAQGRQQFGNVIATRLPVLQVQHYPLPMPAEADMRCMQRMCSVVTVADEALGPVRIMTTHLEYFSSRQRMAQARALRALHMQACALADMPPKPASDGSPYQTKPHTHHAVLCGDFNFEPHEAEYAELSAPWGVNEGTELQAEQWLNSWSVLHGDAPQPATFRLADRTWGPEPGACDFIWVSRSLRQQVKAWTVDSATQASDHQPVMLTLG
ncbi:endonuclease [Comamonas testosteroni]|uniref:Endonuclease n=1 Tax=Comamonas testosteroni TaxID=285 RepID=A0A373FRJ3_COMTE|nr:endonuclease/exonuclease/phosphatase family protein [Comamonas testosteroni]RGE46774.1 endonuclease [Comamonas testosteroni]